MEITTLYQKTRREFGRSVDRFSSTDHSRGMAIQKAQTRPPP